MVRLLQRETASRMGSGPGKITQLRLPFWLGRWNVWFLTRQLYGPDASLAFSMGFGDLRSTHSKRIATGV